LAGIRVFRRYLVAALATGLLVGMGLLGGCGGATGTGQTPEGGSSQGRLTLTGSSTIAPLMLEIGRRFETQHPGIRVDVQSGGTARGVADTRSGLADIGMVSRALKPEEADLTVHLIAHDGIGLIVHADNPIEGLTAQQVVDIYTGRVGRWAAVGGPDSPITVVNKAEGRSTLELFLAHFGLRSPDIAAQVVIGENEQGIKTVAGSPEAIGYVSIGSAEYAAAQGVPVKLLSLDGVPASTQTVRAGTYPLARELNLVTKGPASGSARELIDYATSTAVGDLVKELYFVPPG